MCSGRTIARTQRRLRGFTLTEVLLASALGLITLVGILTAALQALGGIRQVRMGLEAKTAAERQMERLRNQTFNAIAAMPPATPFPDTDGNGVADGLENLPGAAGTIYVDEFLASEDFRRVTVTVALDASRSWRLVSLFSRRGQP